MGVGTGVGTGVRLGRGVRVGLTVLGELLVGGSSVGASPAVPGVISATRTTPSNTAAPKSPIISEFLPGGLLLTCFLPTFPPWIIPPTV